ncbi:MAG: hypothetical protein WD738_21835 [Pirellulales bacterium]
MRIGWTVGVLVSVALVAGGRAGAQLPTATGRQISMSNSAWKMFIPSTYHQRPGNVADLLVHFHGDPQTVWNNAKYANLNAVVVTVNYSGLSSAYSTPFSNASLFQSLLNEALAKVRLETDIPDILQWDKLGVSSFSAGYGAVREILKSATYRNEIDALLAADSLYATTAGDGTPLDSQMVDYKTFAMSAKNGAKTFLFSHSQVPTFTYESTMETGNELMQHLGISASAINTNGLGTLNFYRKAQSGNFQLWGATGTDGDAHLEHLRYIGEFLEDLPLAKVPPPGDYNGDSAVDATDYIIWRQTLGSTTDLRANGNKTAASTWVIDGADYNVWRANFGNTAPGGGATAAAAGDSISAPEPAAWMLWTGVAVLCQFIRRGGAKPPLGHELGAEWQAADC